MSTPLSVVVAVAVLGGVALFIVVQQRHDSTLVERLRPLVGTPVTLGISVGNSQLSVAVFSAVLDSVDARSRWVTFQSLDPHLDSPRLSPAPPMTLVAAYRDDGMLADRIAWIEPDGAERIDLN